MVLRDSATSGRRVRSRGCRLNGALVIFLRLIATLGPLPARFAPTRNQSPLVIVKRCTLSRQVAGDYEQRAAARQFSDIPSAIPSREDTSAPDRYSRRHLTASKNYADASLIIGRGHPTDLPP